MIAENRKTYQAWYYTAHVKDKYHTATKGARQSGTGILLSISMHPINLIIRAPPLTFLPRGPFLEIDTRADPCRKRCFIALLAPISNGTEDIPAVVHGARRFHVSAIDVPGQLAGCRVEGVFAGDGWCGVELPLIVGDAHVEHVGACFFDEGVALVPVVGGVVGFVQGGDVEDGVAA